jgi:hypothetical protein
MICETQSCGSEAFNEVLTCRRVACLCDACAAHVWGAATQRDEVSADLEGFDRGLV